MEQNIRVIKLGGSLLGLPGLPKRLDDYLNHKLDKENTLNEQRLLIVGGGRAADLVRGFDEQYRLDGELGHWLAVRAMQLNAYLVAGVLRRARIVSDSNECSAAWSAGDVAIVDPLAWLEEEHRCGVAIPHRWSFTSDSIAAHIAVRLSAQSLTLLKSAVPHGSCDVTSAAQKGIIDEDFEAASAGIKHIDLVNLRERPAACCVLR